MALTRRHTGIVTEVRPYTAGALALTVEMDSIRDETQNVEQSIPPPSVVHAQAIAYVDLVGAPAVGERVLLNTTAMELRLGTGGVHFVVARLPGMRPSEGAGFQDRAEENAPLPGHMIKLRYTPHQCAVLAAEEEGSPYRSAAEMNSDLDATPVVACELHSQVPAVAAAFLCRIPEARVIFVMTGGAALALSFSKLIPVLEEARLIHGTITAGQCFGGDLEAINVYSGLLLARYALSGDLIIVGQGPGNAGTGTRFGFSGLEQGEAANAAASLGGRPLICLRASAADPRGRHQSPSHHTLTILDRVVRCRCTVAIARDAPGARRRQIHEALRELEIHERHDIVENRGGPGLGLLEQHGIAVTSMGRSMTEDREFFLHAGAAGDAAATMVERRF